MRLFSLHQTHRLGVTAPDSGGFVPLVFMFRGVVDELTFAKLLLEVVDVPTIVHTN